MPAELTALILVGATLALVLRLSGSARKDDRPQPVPVRVRAQQPVRRRR